MENQDRKYACLVEGILNRSLDEFPYWDELTEWTIDEAVRRGDGENAVRLELACGRTALAGYKAQDFESGLETEAKARIVTAFYEAGETETARRLQHRWMITKHLPGKYHP